MCVHLLFVKGFNYEKNTLDLLGILNTLLMYSMNCMMCIIGVRAKKRFLRLGLKNGICGSCIMEVRLAILRLMGIALSP